MPDPSPIAVRPATEADISVILDLIRSLAEYEHSLDQVETTEAQLRAALFGERPAAEAAVAIYDGVVAGMALWFQTFSTWTGRPGLWLEDLFVREEYRRRGVGHALFVHLAGVAKSRGYGRIEWSVLDWNEMALDFYRGLGARAESDWTTHRLAGADIDRLADLDA